MCQLVFMFDQIKFSTIEWFSAWRFNIQSSVGASLANFWNLFIYFIVGIFFSLFVWRVSRTTTKRNMQRSRLPSPIVLFDQQFSTLYSAAHSMYTNKQLHHGWRLYSCTHTSSSRTHTNEPCLANFIEYGLSVKIALYIMANFSRF